ncbi:MAG TPA: hypothetical protein VFI85_00535, partial [Methyloceanibacter sp.]|nr:hypothetical protein [Methyloceanibacter sp.]
SHLLDRYRGSEVVLDTAFAKELGVPQFGKVKRTFAGGQTAEVEQGGSSRSPSVTGPSRICPW